jgi:hypothetical protein
MNEKVQPKELTVCGQNSGALSNAYSKVSCSQVSPIATVLISVSESSRRERVAADSVHRQFIG